MRVSAQHKLPILDKSHAERAHSELGGSSAHRWLHCSGSVLLSRSVTSRPASDAALEGTRLHEIAEKEVNNLIEYYQKGVIPTDGTETYDYSVHEEDAIVSVITALYEKIFNKHLTGKHIKAETEFTIDERFDMKGTADVWAVFRDNYGKRAGLITDFKFGYDPVPAKGNAQLAFYAVGLLKYIRKIGKDLDYIDVYILQPKVSAEPLHDRITAKKLESWDAKFTEAARKIYVEKKFNYKVGDWCKFCPAKPICNTYMKATEKELSMNLVNIDDVEFAEPETLGMDIVEKLVLNLEVIQDYMNQCKSYLIQQLKGGYESKAVKIVEGSTRRGWKKNKTDAIIKYLKKLGVSEPTVAELKNIGKIEKELSIAIRKSQKLKGEALKNHVTELLSKATEHGKASYKLVPITDVRPAVKSALSLFTNDNESSD
jgi:hypothetical protein